MNASTAVWPFGGFVVNINARTIIHVDPNDEDKYCAVLAVNDCKGGQLVLLEPGIVLELKCRDLVVFCSRKISHFNCHYEGYCMSLVFHSDYHNKTWREREDGSSRNGWGSNININGLHYNGG